MYIIANAVFPTIVLLALGNILRRRDILTMPFWGNVDKLTYFVLFPALLVTKVSQVDLSIISFSQVFAFIFIYFTVISALAYGIYHYAGTAINQFSSIYQGVIRFNTYILFAIVEPIWGQDTLSLAALFAGLVIPITNICCVASFSVGAERFSWSKTLGSIIQNPLIIAAGIGFIINLFPVLMPKILFNSLSILGSAALPLALLSVGAAVRIKMLLKKHEHYTRASLWLSTVSSLLIAPMITYLAIWLLGVNLALGNVLVMYAAVPTATSSFILAKQLGGDSDMMATIISLQTVFSMITLTFWLFVLT